MMIFCLCDGWLWFAAIAGWIISSLGLVGVMLIVGMKRDRMEDLREMNG
jgi:hypothetical protein